jgi:hypothetical protein
VALEEVCPWQQYRSDPMECQSCASDNAAKLKQA